jgi:serine phosphatase RsbU (regulator of sigma subunit)
MEKYGYVENLEQRYKTNNGKEFIALLSVKPIKYKDEDAYIGMVVDVTKQKDIEKEIKLINKQMKDSIEYASLIQHALIPSNDLFRKYFSDYLTIWHPKDIVGGDIYLFEELRDDNECILMVIDCTGHGVPGAFVTMLVKAIERQIVSNIKNSNEIVSPAKILSIFNKSMKHLLKQEDEYSISNAGFDGGILYYNKKERIIKFAGAQIPLFYEYQGEIKIIKGDRQSIGYKKSDANFEFNEFTVEVKEGMQFYITTDGYLDQNGGEKDFPFGKKRFAKIIKENYKLPFADQQEVFLYEMMNYQGNNDRNDDMAIVGIKI